MLFWPKWMLSKCNSQHERKRNIIFIMQWFYWSGPLESILDSLWFINSNEIDTWSNRKQMQWYEIHFHSKKVSLLWNHDVWQNHFWHYQNTLNQEDDNDNNNNNKKTRFISWLSDETIWSCSSHVNFDQSFRQ